MSIIHLNQIKTHLYKLFETEIDMSDIKAGGKNYEDFFLTRALAAYSIHFLSNASPTDSAKAVTDGGNDNGLDAVYYDQNEKRLYIVQSKWIKSGKGEPSNGDIKKFLAGVTHLFNLRFDLFNEKVQRFKEDIIAAVTDPNSKYTLVVVYTGINGLAIHSSRDINELINDLNDASDIVEACILKQTDLHTSLTIGLEGEPIDLDITLQSWGKVQEPYLAYYGQVGANQIADWWNKYHTRLFSKNIRSILGDTEINNEIRETLGQDSKNFWYFNNGITLVATKIKKTMEYGSNTDIGTIHCDKVSIVNGAQTVGTIGRFASNPLSNVDNVYIPFRIISLEGSPTNFGKAITRANNRQNKIENRDFAALDPEQIRIKTELAIDGITYQVIRSEKFEAAEDSFDVVESTIALACASGDGQIVVQLKREIGKLWEDTENVPYRTLFNPSISGMFVWRCVKIQRCIDQELYDLQANSSEQESGIIIHGNRLLAALIFNRLKPKKFKDPDYSIDMLLQSKEIRSLAKEYSNRVCATIYSKYKNAIIPTLFKNRTKCEDLLKTCLENQGGKLTTQLEFDLFR